MAVLPIRGIATEIGGTVPRTVDRNGWLLILPGGLRRRMKGCIAISLFAIHLIAKTADFVLPSWIPNHFIKLEKLGLISDVKRLVVTRQQAVEDADIDLSFCVIT